MALRTDEPSKALALGVILSVVAHLCAAMALVAAEHWAPAPEAAAPPERPLANLPEKKDQQITLGETESKAISMTWLGYDEYRKQSADVSVVEQAAMQRDPSSGGPRMPAIPAPNPQAIARAVAEPAEHLAEKVIDAVRGLPMPPTADAGEVAADPKATPDAKDPTKVADADESAKPSPADTTPVEKADRPTPETNPQPAMEGDGATQGPGSGASTSNGAQSDRESDASSIVEAQVKELGQPLAARGLRIVTTKPKLSYRTQIMGGGMDPVVRLFFASDGRVRNVEFLQRSGNPDIDRPVEDALYFWRAEGEALAALGDPEKGDTLSIDVRILR